MSDEFEVISKHKGEEFVGLSYLPPFSFVPVEKGHEVLAADFVASDSGTGIVHIAPAYGEDDYHVAQENGLDFIRVVDASGCYMKEVVPLAGVLLRIAMWIL